MTNPQRSSLGETDVEQAITILKRGSYLLKYGRRGKPKFCPFWLSNDETTLIWYAKKEVKQLQLSQVSRIIPGQRTAVFQRYARPEKEYQSFSLIYGKGSLDVICKDKEEAEIWFVALRALISCGNCQKWRSEAGINGVSSDGSSALHLRNSQSFASSSRSNIVPQDPRTAQTILIPYENSPQKRLGRAFSDFLTYSTSQISPQTDIFNNSRSPLSSESLDNLNDRMSQDSSRFSLSAAVSSSSQGSLEDIDISDVLIWGQGVTDGLPGGGLYRIRKFSAAKTDALLPKALESTFALDAQSIACGSRHAVLLTKQGEMYSWGEGSGGRLGHGIDADVFKPKLINTLRGLNIKSVACGEYHTCAVTLSGDLYTWGDGIHNFGLLGHGTEVGQWTPKRVRGLMEGMRVQFVSCGPWHTAVVTSMGQLLTFGDGTFGALGHGDRNSTVTPREVEKLKGMWTVKACCGVWHTAAVVEVTSEPSSSASSSSGKLFTWGNGNEGQLGHGDKEPTLVPSCVAVLDDMNFCQVACGHSITIALTTSGKVYTMGSSDYGQRGSPGNAGKLPTCVEGKLKNKFIEAIACGFHHVAALSSNSEIYTWGKGANGQLGHGDNDDRNTPTLVEALKDKRVKSVVCGSNFTAAICLYKRVCFSDYSMCSGCRRPFNFRRNRHNCYNCGLVFCKTCSSKRSLKASLAPTPNKPYRVCEDCFIKLNKVIESGLSQRPPKVTGGKIHCSSGEDKEKETLAPKSHKLLSRISSFDSLRQVGIRHSKQNRKFDSNIGHVSPIENGSPKWDSSSSNSSPSIFEYSEKASASVPGSTIQSQAASPISVKSSPASVSPRSAFTALVYPEVILDDTNQTDENLNREIPFLQEQVEILTRRSQFLEAELERTRRQLKEAAKLASNEGEKTGAAKEVIKSLTRQLKDMAERVSQESSFCRISSSFPEKASRTLPFPPLHGSQLTS